MIIWKCLEVDSLHIKDISTFSHFGDFFAPCFLGLVKREHRHRISLEVLKA